MHQLRVKIDSKCLQWYSMLTIVLNAYSMKYKINKKNILQRESAL